MAESTLRLVSLQPEDLTRLEKIAAPWRDSWSPQELHDSLLAGHHGVVLMDQQQPLGYGVYRLLPDVMEILNIAIFFQERSKGYGRILIDSLEQVARECDCTAIWLEVRASNHPALRLYGRCGFEASGRRRAYYRAVDGPRVDAILMQKDLAAG